MVCALACTSPTGSYASTAQLSAKSNPSTPSRQVPVTRSPNHAKTGQVGAYFDRAFRKSGPDLAATSMLVTVFALPPPRPRSPRAASRTEIVCCVVFRNELPPPVGERNRIPREKTKRIRGRRKKFFVEFAFFKGPFLEEFAWRSTRSHHVCLADGKPSRKYCDVQTM